MAHFAQLDETNIVTQVIVVHNNELLDNGVESEAKGVAFCQSLFGGTWVQTSYNGNIRKNFAGIGIHTIQLLTTSLHLNRILLGYWMLMLFGKHPFLYQMKKENFSLGTRQHYLGSK